MKYRAEWLARRGQHSKALQCIEDAIPTHETSPTSKTELSAKRDASDLATAATEIERLGHLVQSDAEDVYQQAAEEFYRLAAEADRRKRFLLVSFLIRQRRSDEALSILRSSSIDREDLIDALSLIDALARSPGLELSQLESIDAILTELSVEYGESISLNAARASLQKASGHDERAMRIYREILEQDENNLLALNNLALLLVRSKERLSEARRLSLRAVELGGRTPELLDTLAVIAIIAGQHQRAVELLQEVTRRSETPVFQLHLAVAHLRSGDAIRANEQFERARSAGLERSALGERDRRWFDEVAR